MHYHILICNLYIISSGFLGYLLYVSDVHKLDNFILLGGAGPGAGALKAQVTDGDTERKQPAERPKERQAGRQNGHT